MNDSITISIDAMGGDNSPDKIINGISIYSKEIKNTNFKIFGDKSLIEPLVNKYNINKNQIEIFHTINFVKGDDSALSAAKKGKDTSMWLSIESLKNNEADAIVSAGNTGALFVIAKLNLNMIENIDKPALSGLLTILPY